MFKRNKLHKGRDPNNTELVSLVGVFFGSSNEHVVKILLQQVRAKHIYAKDNIIRGILLWENACVVDSTS